MSAELRARTIEGDDEIWVHIFDHPRRSIYVRDEERAAYAETHDATPPTYGAGMYLGARHREFDKEEFWGAVVGFGALALIAAALGWALLRAWGRG